MEVTISIVSFNTKDLLRRCINSIYKYTKDISFEVIVVDNGSQDDTVEVLKKEFPQVKVIANQENKFFSKANNQVLTIAKGKYFLILNSDTFFIDNSIKKMFDYLQKNPSVGACEGLEIYENGRDVPTGSMHVTPLIDFYELSLLGKRIKDQKMIDQYRLKNKDRKDTFEIEVGCDAFLMVRTELMRKIQGYDEKLLLYYTENDLCLRLQKLGVKIMHLGNAKIMHKVSASAVMLGSKKTIIYYQDSLNYYRKHQFAFLGILLYTLLTIERIILNVREKVW